MSLLSNDLDIHFSLLYNLPLSLTKEKPPESRGGCRFARLHLPNWHFASSCCHGRECPRTVNRGGNGYSPRVICDLI